MLKPLELEKSRAFPVAVDRAFEVVLPAPLERVFSRRYAVLPAVTGVRDQDGVWGRVGQSRVICLADGGTMTEVLTTVAEPREFRYRIQDVTGPMKALVASIDGRWSFSPAGTGTRITWAWTVHPSSSAARLAMPLLERLWPGYARQALEQIEGLLVRD